MVPRYSSKYYSYHRQRSYVGIAVTLGLTIFSFQQLETTEEAFSGHERLQHVLANMLPEALSGLLSDQRQKSKVLLSFFSHSVHSTHDANIC